MKKFMQWKLAALAALVLVLGGISNANAITLGCYQEGVLVPVAYHNAADVDTVVSLTSTCSGMVYWTFFSKDSDHLFDNYFSVTKNDLASFSLKEELGCDLIDEQGYLVFSFGGNDTSVMTPGADGCTNALAANAYIIDITNNDAIFIPVLPLDNSDYKPNHDLMAMTFDSIINASYGTPQGNTVDIRYWVDPDYCAETSMIVWTVGDPCTIGPRTVNIYDDSEHRVSLTMCWKYCELNIFDPTNTGASANTLCDWDSRADAADFTAWPSSYVDGFMRIQMPFSGIAWSYVTSTTIGAAQTMLAAEQCGVVFAPTTPPCPCP